MITTTVTCLLSVKSILQKIANTSMPAKDAFSILKMLKAIDKEYESIEVIQKRMLDTYGVKKSNGEFETDQNGNYIIQQDKIEKYVEEMQPFLNEKIELNCSKINIDLLNKIDISPTQLLLIEDFIEE